MQNTGNILYKIIGKKIKSKRTELGFSQDYLSKQLNIARSSISNIEIGRQHMPLILLYQISDLLGLEIKELLPSNIDLLKSNHTFNDEFSKIIDSKTLNDSQKEGVRELINNIN